MALIDAATALLAKRKRDIPDGFSRQAVRARGARGSGALHAPTSLPASPSARGRFSPSARPARPRSASSRPPRTRGVSVLEIVNDDMPFLVDSVVGELNHRGLDIRLFVHPVFIVERDDAGRLVNFKGARTVGGQRESFIHIHVDGVDDAAQRAEIVHALESILADVRVCVQDWQPMLARARGVIADLRTNPPPLPVEEIAEAIQFLEWIVDDNFTLLGARDYAFTDSEDALDPVFETGLGLLRSRDMRLLAALERSRSPSRRKFARSSRSRSSSSSPRRRCARACTGAFISITSASSASTATASSSANAGSAACSPRPPIRAPARTIPYLRRKIDSIIRRAGFDPSSHSGKALVNVLETYPRDELFQIDEDTLYQFALAILQLDERPRVRVLPRRDRFDRFVSVLVYVPRDRYDSQIRAAIGNYLAAAFNGRDERLLSVLPGRAAGARPFHHRTRRGRDAESGSRVARSRGRSDRAQLDRRPARGARRRPRSGARARAVRALSRCLPDRLSRSLSAGDGARRYRRDRGADAGAAARRRALPRGRRGAAERRAESVQPQPADPALGTRAGAGEYGLSRRRRAHLSHPAGGRARRSGSTTWTLESALGQDFDLAALKERLEACFLVVMGKKAESDGYNALVLATGLGWRDVALIRTISRFLRQIRVPYSQDYMWTTLRKYPGIAAQIVTLVPDPLRSASRRIARTSARRARPTSLSRIETALQAVESLDEDRILRHFVNAVTAAIRTNFYQLGRDGRVEGTDRDQVFQPQGRRHAVAAAALRNLRLFAAARSRASALRQGGARRHPLVRPAAGFPHRNPRPGQGAERQERRDRAGRRQRRLRSEISAGRRAAGQAAHCTILAIARGVRSRRELCILVEGTRPPFLTGSSAVTGRP